MRKGILSLLIIVFVFGFVQIASAVTLDQIKARGYVKVGIDIDNEPFEYYDKNKNIVGFDIDIMKKIAEQWGVDVRYKIVGWDDLIPSLAARKFDMVIAPMTITPKRAMVIAFTLPHFNAGQTVVVRSKERRIKSHKDLKGRRVIAQEGTTGEEAARTIKGAVLVHNAGLNMSQCNEAVINKKADAHIVDRPMAYASAKSSRGKLKVVGNPFTIEYYGYSVNKSDTELLMQLNQALTIIKEDGTYDKVMDKWF